MKKTSVIIPALNEEVTIGTVIDEVLDVLKRDGYDPEIIVVDDGSTDQTAVIAQKKGARLIRHPVPGGYGSALRDGILAASNKALLIIDGDGTYPTDKIPDILGDLEKFDMVVGARSGAAYRESLLKHPLRYIFQLLCGFVTGVRIPDANSGLRAFKKDTVLKFKPEFCLGFSFTTTITLAYHLNGYFVRYIPISYRKRIGRSHVRLFKDSLRTAQIITETILYYNPIKLFLLLAIFTLLAAAFAFFCWTFWGALAGMVLGQALVIVGLLFFGMGLVVGALRPRRDLGKG